jgi:hypothetical protein
MKLKLSLCLMMVALTALTACSETQPAATAFSKGQASPLVKPTPEDASFFAAIPFSPDGNQVLETKPVEVAFLSIAAMDAELPLDNWTQLGWTVGGLLDESERVPQDCALHYRNGVNRQAYAVCAGPAKVSIPHDGGDFVYIVFTDADNRIARVMQSGAKYNPDSTGLIP